MSRRTKIVATLGPATDKSGVLEGIIKAGVNVVRLNFSHGTHEDHIKRASDARRIAKELGQSIGILSDLQGPKIRVDCFVEGHVELEYNQTFILDSDLDEFAGTKERVGLAYKELPQDVKPGNILLLDDGKIILEVTKIIGNEVYTRVEVAGTLSNRKGINLQGGGLSAPALTEKDKQDLICAASFHTDFLAISFPRSAEDVIEARNLLTQANSDAAIIAKIERLEALDNIDEIILASDAIMIARGDLAVEIGDAKLVGVQKRFIRRARQLNRAVITATQMMESMIENQSPTRAEVMDVANAVIDGTDAVMLSAETAAGKYPVKTVRAMAQICIGAESEIETKRSNVNVDNQFERTDEAIALASMYIANHYNVKAIICLTETGHTTLLMSRISSDIPIFGMTRHQKTAGRLTLYRGVHPIEFSIGHDNDQNMTKEAVNVLKKLNVVTTGDRVILTRGFLNYETGGTNNLRIVEVH